jgi:hypothetical protein
MCASSSVIPVAIGPLQGTDHFILQAQVPIIDGHEPRQHRSLTFPVHALDGVLTLHFNLL